jgi:hypothetical protein
MGRKFNIELGITLTMIAVLTGCASRPGDLPKNAPLVRAIGKPTGHELSRPANGPFDLVWSYNNEKVVTISGNNLDLIYWGPINQPPGESPWQATTESTSLSTPRHYAWHRVTFTLTDDQTAGLRKLLIDTNFCQLAREYDTNLADGTVVEVTLGQADYEQTVYCNNYFPQSVRKLSSYLNGILKPHATEIAAAGQIDQKQAVRAILQASP